MGMESVYRLSVILNMVDNLSGQMRGAGDSVQGTVQKLDSAFGNMQKAGAVMTGVGGAVTGLCAAAAAATFDTQNALGELSSLGVKDLKAVERAAKDFSDTWAGTSKADFITASYDIKSGIASLSDEGIAEFTKLAALTGKAAKSTTEEMGSLFAAGYGIYKGFYDDLSDIEFGEMFSAGIATAVKNYKTSGSQMAGSISALGATATNANVPLEEQLAILGQLQTTMSGSEAATKYKSFLNQASKAGEKLGLTFLDTNNQLKSMPEILTELKGKYGDTIDAVEKRELKEAFGTDEAVALIDLLYNNIKTLDTGIQDLQASMKSGISVTEEMAQAINNTPEQKFEVLKQQIHNNVEELGNGLLPVINDTLEKVSGLIQRFSEWVSNNQELVQTIMNIALYLGIFLTVAGGVIGIVGTLGRLFLSAMSAIELVKGAVLAMNTAFLASPITWVIAGITALAAAFVILWNTSETFRNFWIGLFDTAVTAMAGMRDAVKHALEAVKGFFCGIFGDIPSIVREKLGSVKEHFTSVFESAKSTVSGAVDKIKSCFKFSWELPKLKLPHFNISGSFSLNPPSVPKFNVQWYKKGGILNGATIFGAMGNSLLGGGEAGAEAVLPLNELWKHMKEIINGAVSGGNEKNREGLQKAGSGITKALSSKTVSIQKEKESSATTRETRESTIRESGTTINSITFTVDISKIKDLPLLYKLIDELKDAQNRTDDAYPAAT